MPQQGQYSATDLQTTAPAQTGKYSASDLAPAGPSLTLVDQRDPLGLEKDEQGNIYYQGKKLEPKSFAVAPPALGTAAAAVGKALPAVGQGVAQGLKSMLPAVGATVEQTTANVTKWAAEQGLNLAKVGGAWYLVHKFLGGGEK